MRALKYVLAMAIAAALLGNIAQAAFELQLSDGTVLGTKLITDNGVGDSNAATGQIRSTVGGTWGPKFNLNVTTGTSPSTPGVPSIDLNSVNTSNGAGTLTMDLTQTGLTSTSSISALIAQIGGTLATAQTLTGTAWLDPANGVFGHGATKVLLGTFGPGGAFSASGNAGPVSGSTGPFSITEEVTLTTTQAGTSSFNFAADAAPEPTSLAVWSLLSVAGVGVATARRKAGRKAWSEDPRRRPECHRASLDRRPSRREECQTRRGRCQSDPSVVLCAEHF